jgi:photosystem II stability/assembly factor-like uncharacterized protein
MFEKSKSLLIMLIALVVVIPSYADWFVPETGTTGAVYDVVLYQDKLYAASNPSGVFISVNNGNQWIDVNNNLPEAARPAQAMTVLGNQVFVGTDSGIYSTTNNGQKWVAKNSGLGNLVVYQLLTKDNILYAVTDDAGAYYSTDAGSEWYSMNNGDIIGMIFYSIEAADGKVYVGAQDGHIYTSTNRGLEWKDIRSGPLVFAIKALAVNGSKILAGTSVGVYLSNDGGTNWKAINSGLKNTDVTDVKFNGSMFIVSTKGGGLFISNNEGSSWVPINTGLPDLNVLSFTLTSTHIFACSQFASVCRRDLSELVVPTMVAPVLTSPTNGEQHVDYSTTFTWGDVEGTSSYSFRIALSTDFTNTINSKDNLQTTSLKLDLEKGLTYYWQVASVSSDGSKLWSEVWSFTTKEDLTKPVLILPGNAGTSKSPVKFLWNKSKGTVSYKLQIATDMEFNQSFVLNQVNIMDTTFSFDQLKVDSSYFWRVAAVPSAGKEEFSEVWSFKVVMSSVDYLTQDANLVSIYPMPMDKELNLSFNFDAENVKIDIITLDGKSVYDVYSGSIHKDFRIMNSGISNELMPGMYFVRILSDTKNIIMKIIIN